jgi:flagellar biosynthesis protein FlhF
MNIRRFVAPDMREALGAIRAELGADAVMLSSRKLPSGVEVIAAIDYDDSLFAVVEGRRPRAEEAAAEPAPAEALDDEPPQEHDDSPLSVYQRIAGTFAAAAREPEALAVTAAEIAPRPAPVRTEAPAQMPPPPAAVPGAVAEEIKDLRRLLETQLASFAWNETNRRSPVRARLLREMAKLGVDAPLAAQLADAVPATQDSQQALRAAVRLLGERLPLKIEDIAEEGGVYAVVGPTGVGKTTTIAKIAARFVLRHGVEHLGLVSTDTYRVGARQQLFNFARILRAPMHVADNAADLARVLDGFSRKKLVLIDTAGMSQRDERLARQFAVLRAESHHVRTVLALSAAADRGVLNQALAVFRAAQPEALIVTKLDEAASLGAVLSLAINGNVPIAYLTDGQRVPEDLHVAAPKRFWLVHNAVKLTLDESCSPDENELAATFGEMELAANA